MPSPQHLTTDADAWRYALQPSSLELRLRDLLRQHPFKEPSWLGCYRLSGESPYGDIARRIECEVFDEFFGNAADVMALEYGPYERASEFLLVVDRTGARAVGALRLIRHSSAGFKTLNDISGPPLSIPPEAVRVRYGIDDWTQCWDIATVAVVPELRGAAGGQLVSVALYGYLYALAIESGITHFIAILDRHAYRQLTQTFSIPFAPILESPPFNYLGSECSRAVQVRLGDIRPHMEQRLRESGEKRQEFLAPYYFSLLDADGLPPLVNVS